MWLNESMSNTEQVRYIDQDYPIERLENKINITKFKDNNTFDAADFRKCCQTRSHGHDG